MVGSSCKRVGMVCILLGCLFPTVGQLSGRWRALRRPFHENRLLTLDTLHYYVVEMAAAGEEGLGGGEGCGCRQRGGAGRGSCLLAMDENR